jgi:predicted AAA+ superfamily ATPase
MKRRLTAGLIRARLAEYPAVALLGPRQSGKTTLARSLSGLYFDAEQPADRVRLDLEWDQVLGGRRLAVIDEAQTWPELFPRLRGAIDRDRKRMGRVLLLGSVSPVLMREVSESLAGRLALVELTPLLFSEIRGTSLSRQWLQGGFPDGGVLGGDAFPAWQANYARLMAERDLPAWGLPARPQLTLRLLHMLAAVHAQVWNASNLGQSLGLSYHTVNTYLDHLEAAYLVRRLPAWSAQTTKRLIKSPKVLIRDSGLLHSLLGIADREALLRHPVAGPSWEGFVIEQLLGHLAARGFRADAHYLRTSDGHELDLLLQLGTTLVALEVKLSSRASPEDIAKLDRCADLVGAEHRYVVCQTTAPVLGRNRGVLDLAGAAKRLETIAAPQSPPKRARGR